MSATAVQAPKRTTNRIEKLSYAVWEVMQREVSKRGLALTKHKLYGDGRVMVGTIGGVIKALNGERNWDLTDPEVDQVRRYLKATGNVVALEKVEQYRFRILVRETWSNEPLRPEKVANHVGKTSEEKVTPEEAGETREPAPVTYRCATCGKEFPAQASLAGHLSAHDNQGDGAGGNKFILTLMRVRVMEALADLGGRVSDKSGAVAPLVAKQARIRRAGVSAALRDLAGAGYLERDVQGKRTYSASLTPKGWAAIGRTPPAAHPRKVSEPSKTAADVEPTAALNQTPTSALLAELSLRATASEELVACQDRLDVIRVLIGEVNSGALAPLKALADIETALDL